MVRARTTWQATKPNSATNHDRNSLTTAANGVRIFIKMLGVLLPFGLRQLRLRIAAACHHLTYRPVPSPKNVLIVGGSFAGVHLAKWLADTVPTGYRVVLVEKNSHFNYLFAFPRYSVVPGYERGAFVPYDDIFRGAMKKGSFMRVQATASGVAGSQVLLDNGEAVDYAYLVIATGSWQPLPAKLASVESEGACSELRDVQGRIAAAERVAVLGSGAVGVEIAADIKSYFPDKNVTLFSSRDVVMPSFGPKLQDHVAKVLDTLGVNVRYSRRPNALPGWRSIQFSDGTTEEFDVVLSCTGQTPNSSILSDLAPEAISKQTGRILVKPTLQLQLPDQTPFPNIFALGDVAEHMGPRMARAVHMQAEIVRANVLALIHGRSPTQRYSPRLWIEGAIQLTIGKNESVAYIPGDDGKDMLFIGGGYPEDFKIAQGWRLVGARYPGRQEQK